MVDGNIWSLYDGMQYSLELIFMATYFWSLNDWLVYSFIRRQRSEIVYNINFNLQFQDSSSPVNSLSLSVRFLWMILCLRDRWVKSNMHWIISKKYKLMRYPNVFTIINSFNFILLYLINNVYFNYKWPTACAIGQLWNTVRIWLQIIYSWHRLIYSWHLLIFVLALSHWSIWPTQKY